MIVGEGQCQGRRESKMYLKHLTSVVRASSKSEQEWCQATGRAMHLRRVGGTQGAWKWCFPTGTKLIF